MAEFNITVNKIATGLGATGLGVFFGIWEGGTEIQTGHGGTRFEEFDASQESLLGGSSLVSPLNAVIPLINGLNGL